VVVEDERREQSDTDTMIRISIVVLNLALWHLPVHAQYIVAPGGATMAFITTQYTKRIYGTQYTKRIYGTHAPQFIRTGFFGARGGLVAGRARAALAIFPTDSGGSVRVPVETLFFEPNASVVWQAARATA
jgi:hypothetical protein